MSNPTNPNSPILEGDSFLIRNILSPSLSARVADIDSLETEIEFGDMTHRGLTAARKVALQGTMVHSTTGGVDIPLYRTPSDHLMPVLPWSETVKQIRDELSVALSAPFNHAKMQLYRDGTDHITKHSDKTLDIRIGSRIVNLNLGTTRKFTFENKETKELVTLDFEHNSVIVIGWESNRKWTHAVHKDNNSVDKRISMVFREISTFLTESGMVYGQGAHVKDRADLPAVDVAEAHHNAEEAQRMLDGFIEENNKSDFNWMGVYGAGFDVYDFSSLLNNS